MSRVLAVGAVVAHPDGRVLVVRRARAPGAGEWSLPGGKVEPGEAIADAVAREVREETGLRVRVLRALEVFALERDGHAYDIHEHLCAPVDPEAAVVAGDDAADARWAHPDELAGLGVRAGAVAVVRRALASR